MGWDKNSLIGKAKVLHTSKAKQSKARNSLPTSHGQAGVQPSQGNQGSFVSSGDLESQITLKVTLLLPLPPDLYAEHGLAYPLRSPVLAVFSPISLRPSLSPLADEVGSSKGLGNV